MKSGKALTLLVAVVLVLAIAGCASAPRTEASVAAGAALTMKASNFKFDPNTVAVNGTGTISLTIMNTGGTPHNVTVDDPKGKIIASVEIPPNATITTQVTFPAPGDYPFTCNHPLHADFGMKGHFLVSGS